MTDNVLTQAMEMDWDRFIESEEEEWSKNNGWGRFTEDDLE